MLIISHSLPMRFLQIGAHGAPGTMDVMYHELDGIPFGALISGVASPTLVLVPQRVALGSYVERFPIGSIPSKVRIGTGVRISDQSHDAIQGFVM